MTDEARLRIGELSRRVGESPELLRAWETRYGLVTPERTPGGLRLYSARDERRIRTMRRHIDAGLAAAEAARLAKLADEPGPGAEPTTVTSLRAELERALGSLDEPAAQAALDRLLATVELRQALGEVILPFLRGIGERWADARTTVAQEHFASHVIGGRLRSLAQGWGDGVGPLAVLACPPGERHELGLLAFGLVLRQRGWRIVYLGADTPIGDVATTAAELRPAIVVLAAIDPARFRRGRAEIQALAARVRVGLGGPGASAPAARRLGAEALTGELVGVADTLAP